MKVLKVEANVDKLPEVLSFADGILEEYDCPLKVQMQLDIAIEELFVNIARYAYTSGTGDAVISIDVTDDPRGAVITFEDEGIPYDPLKKEDPDISLTAEERPIGGLGIYMVKKSMDDVSYRYEDGKNILTICKRF